MLCLVDIFQDVDVLAKYLSQDPVDILRWANSETLSEPPVWIDYTYLLFKHPEFNQEWLEDGTGEIYLDANEEKHTKEIRDEKFTMRLEKEHRL